MGAQQSNQKAITEFTGTDLKLNQGVDHVKKLSKGQEGGVSQKESVQEDVMDISMLMGSSKQRDRIWSHSFEPPADVGPMEDEEEEKNESSGNDASVAVVISAENHQVPHNKIDETTNSSCDEVVVVNGVAEDAKETDEMHKTIVSTGVGENADHNSSTNGKCGPIEGLEVQAMDLSPIIQRLFSSSDINLQQTIKVMMTSTQEDVSKKDAELGKVGLPLMIKWCKNIDFKAHALEDEQVNDIVKFVTIQAKRCGLDNLSSFDIALMPVRIRSTYHEWHEDPIKHFKAHQQSDFNNEDIDGIINDFFCIMYAVPRLHVGDPGVMPEHVSSHEVEIRNDLQEATESTALVHDDIQEGLITDVPIQENNGPISTGGDVILTPQTNNEDNILPIPSPIKIEVTQCEDMKDSESDDDITGLYSKISHEDSQVNKHHSRGESDPIDWTAQKDDIILNEAVSHIDVTSDKTIEQDVTSAVAEDGSSPVVVMTSVSDVEEPVQTFISHIDHQEFEENSAPEMSPRSHTYHEEEFFEQATPIARVVMSHENGDSTVVIHPHDDRVTGNELGDFVDTNMQPTQHYDNSYGGCYEEHNNITYNNSLVLTSSRERQIPFYSAQKDFVHAYAVESPVHDLDTSKEKSKKVKLFSFGKHLFNKKAESAKQKMDTSNRDKGRHYESSQPHNHFKSSSPLDQSFSSIHSMPEQKNAFRQIDQEHSCTMAIMQSNNLNSHHFSSNNSFASNESRTDPALEGKQVSATFFIHDNAVLKMPVVSTLPIVFKPPTKNPEWETKEKTIVLDFD